MPTASRRIVSLVPSLTHTLVEMGLEQDIIGITNFCIDPLHLHRNSTSIGGTKDVDVDLVQSLKPSHVFANREENVKAQVERISSFCPVLTTFPKSPDDVPGMIESIANFLKLEPEAHAIAAKLRSQLKGPVTNLNKTFLYFIWKDPWMVAGHDTYISRLLEKAGLHNAAPTHARYPSADIEWITKNPADIYLFSSEPWPFRRREITDLWNQMDGFRTSYKIDGKLCSWFGAYTAEAMRIMAKDPLDLLEEVQVPSNDSSS